MIQRLQQKRNEEGFTLIELLIVIIVLGILAAIVVFAIGSTRKDSVASACKSNWKAVELSAEAVNTKSGNYGAVANPNAMNDLLQSAGHGGLLKTVPSTGTDYSLVYAGTRADDPATVADETNTPPFTGYTISVMKGATLVGTTVDACSNL